MKAVPKKILHFFTIEFSECDHLNYSADDMRRIRMVNTISLIGAVNVVFYAVFFAFLNTALCLNAMPYFILETGLTFGVILINKQRHFTLAKTSIALLFPVFLAINTQVVFGKDTNTEIFILMFSLIPLFLWSFKEKIYLILITIFNLIIYIFIEFVPSITEPKVPIPIEYIEVIKNTHFFAVFLGIAFAIAVFQKFSSEKEEQLLKQAIEIKKSQEHRDLIYSIIAHDLRSPFNGLMGLSDILIKQYDDFDDEKKRNLLEAINTSSSTLNSLLENLLDWSKMQSGNMNINFENLNLKLHVAEVNYLLDNILKCKGLNPLIDIDDTLVVFADANMISTVIRNILTNAIKFTPEGGLLKINAKPYNGIIEICISDSGVGIPHSKIAELLSNNSRYSRLGTNNEKGSGLGLKICRDFVEANGGRMWIESQENKGSSFYFTLNAGV